VINNATFCALILGASLGLRWQEMKARQLFNDIAEERTRRAQAEFCAATSQNQALTRTKEDDVHTLGAQSTQSLALTALTTETGKLFEHLDLEEAQTVSMLQELGIREQWLIKRSELEVHSDDELGCGGFGMVVAGTFCKGAVAIKRYKAKKDANTIIDELRIMRHVRHPNIALFHGAVLSSGADDILLVLERIRGMELSNVVMKLGAWMPSSPNKEAQTSVMLQVCQALIYLHTRENSIVHADVKPDNIMVIKQGGGLCPKLLDFGLARRATYRARQTSAGTPAYMAPETLQPGHKASCAGDVYAMGLLLFFTASGRRPLARYKPTEIVQVLRAGEVPGLAWSPDTELLSKWKDTILLCTRVDPSQRLVAEQVYDSIAASDGRRKSVADSKCPGTTPRQTVVSL